MTYAHFICGQQYDGSMHQTSEDFSSGLLSWYRLVGCVYFKDANAAFLDQVPTNNPVDLFRALHDPSNSPMVNHCILLDKIRAAVPYRVPSEEYALAYHWKRVSWVSQLWAQSDNCEIVYPDVEDWGWERTEHALKCVWDSPKNLANIQLRVDAWEKGCSCSTGCATKQCGCRKRGQMCGPGCTCETRADCKNVGYVENDSNSDNESDSSEDDLEQYVTMNALSNEL